MKRMTRDRARVFIVLATREIEEELAKPDPVPLLDAGERLEESKRFYMNQPIEMKTMLEKMLKEVETANIPPREKRLGGMGRSITDSWRSGTELAEVIISAEDAYWNI